MHSCIHFFICQFLDSAQRHHIRSSNNEREEHDSYIPCLVDVWNIQNFLYNSALSKKWGWEVICPECLFLCMSHYFPTSHHPGNIVTFLKPPTGATYSWGKQTFSWQRWVMEWEALSRKQTRFMWTCFLSAHKHPSMPCWLPGYDFTPSDTQSSDLPFSLGPSALSPLPFQQHSP